MKLAYVDPSCLIAIALGELGGAALAKRSSRFNRLLSSNLLEAELRSAQVREGVRDDGARLLSWLGWVHPDRPLTPEFRRVLGVGQVRGADVWYLACALFLNGRPGAMSFVTLGRNQRELATQLGFGTKG